MKNRTIFASVLLLLICGGVLVGTDLPLTNENKTEQPIKIDQEVPPLKGNLSITSSREFKNLKLFLIEGNEQLKEKDYVPLARALEKGWVTVHETSNVNALSVSNNSDHFVYIAAGDIVEGGKQDRTLQDDLIVGPGTRKENLASFCVESGRWKQRGKESTGTFASANYCLSSNELKVASRVNRDQQVVWSKVAENNGSLSASLSKSEGKSYNISSEKSPTSLNLALQDTLLNQRIDEITEYFEGFLASTENEMGYAYAINGEVMAVELYNNSQLLNELWDKLLKAMITESMAKESEVEYDSSTASEVAFLINEKKDLFENRNLNKHTDLKSFENEEAQLIELSTIDRKAENKWLHKSILKTPEKSTNKKKNPIRQMRYNDLEEIFGQ
ncbi:MAG: DUF6569 family protein [Bacteroidota bacterium]